MFILTDSFTVPEKEEFTNFKYIVKIVYLLKCSKNIIISDNFQKVNCVEYVKNIKK